MRHFHRIILGATSSGIGAFLADPKNSFILEQSTMIGSDFAGTFFPGKLSTLSEVAKKHPLYNNSIKCKTIIGEDVHLAGFHTLLFDFLTPLKKNILLDTKILSYEKKSDHFEVKVYNRSGHETLTCTELIDATKECLTNKSRIVDKKFISAIFFNPVNGEKIPQLSKGQVFKSAYTHEFYWHLAVDPNMSWYEARKLVRTCVSELKSELNGWFLAAMGYEFRSIISTKYQGPAKYLNPYQYDSFLETIVQNQEAFTFQEALS